MKIAIFYSSPHGKTRRVVVEAANRLAVSPDVYDVRTETVVETLLTYDLLLFFAPTYGDEELEDSMDAFLSGPLPALSDRWIGLCELGNSYGYDDFRFGAMEIMRQRLSVAAPREFCEPLSLDAFPRTDWDQLHRWVEMLNAKIGAHV